MSIAELLSQKVSTYKYMNIMFYNKYSMLEITFKTSEIEMEEEENGIHLYADKGSVILPKAMLTEVRDRKAWQLTHTGLVIDLSFNN